MGIITIRRGRNKPKSDPKPVVQSIDDHLRAERRRAKLVDDVVVLMIGCAVSAFIVLVGLKVCGLL